MRTFYRGMTRLLEPLAASVLRLTARGESQELLDERLALAPSDVAQIWCHASSLGEIAALIPVLEYIQERFPGRTACVTTSTVTGRRRAADLSGIPVSLAPLDLPGPVRRAFRLRRPEALVLIETELWPNLITEALSRAVPIGILNGRISDGAWPRYRRTRWFWKPLLRGLSAVAARTENDAERFEVLGVQESAIRVTGNSKHDGYKKAETLDLSWPRNEVIILGSVHPDESGVLFPAMTTLWREHPALKMLLAPRHLDTAEHWLRLARREGIRTCRWTDGINESAQLVLLDAYGVLSRAYATGSVALVGGSFSPRGGHNPMEACAQEIPVIMGPHHHTVSIEASELRRMGALVVGTTSEEIVQAVSVWMGDSALREAAGRKGLAVVNRNSGAVRSSVEWLSACGVLEG